MDVGVVGGSTLVDQTFAAYFAAVDELITVVDHGDLDTIAAHWSHYL